MIKRVILFTGLISTLCFGHRYPVENIHKDVDTLFTIVSDTHEVNINGSTLQLDLRRLLLMTAMVESNMARDRYRGRVAKTYLQIEENTAKWYLSQVTELREYVESRLGRKLIWNRDKDAVFTAYLLYMSKIQQHNNILNNSKYLKEYFINNDIDYYIYKLLYNSIKGKSTYSKWVEREEQFIKRIMEDINT